MRTTDRVFGKPTLTVQTWPNAPGFSPSGVSRYGKSAVVASLCRRSPKKVLWSAAGSGAPHRFFFGEQTWGSILVSLGVFSGTSLTLSRLLLLGLSDFVNKWQQCHIMLASPPGRPI